MKIMIGIVIGVLTWIVLETFLGIHNDGKQQAVFSSAYKNEITPLLNQLGDDLLKKGSLNIKDYNNYFSKVQIVDYARVSPDGSVIIIGKDLGLLMFFQPYAHDGKVKWYCNAAPRIFAQGECSTVSFLFEHPFRDGVTLKSK